MKNILRTLRACWFLIRAPRYILYTAEDAVGNLHRIHTSRMVLMDDLYTLQAWGNAVESENTEASAALGDLLEGMEGIEPAA